MRELLQTAALALSVAGLCYYIYFLLAPWVWSRNISFTSADITPWILEWTGERDGVEIYALYILMFVNTVAAVALNGAMGRCTGKNIQRTIIVLCLIVTGFYCSDIGFTPPMNTLRSAPPAEVLLKSLFLLAMVLPVVGLLHHLQRRSSRWALAVVALLLAPVCFIATEPISWIDYSYIFAPALRLLHGAPLSGIYFQYDLLPSLLAAGWMKLGLDLNTFQILGQAGYYATILGIFLLSGKLFRSRTLPLFLLTALVLGRIYASPADVVSCFQVTPLRLDLWLPLLAAVYFRGPFHWSAGLVCGLLLLLLRNFGIIYSIAYLQLLITLFAVGRFDAEKGTSLPGSLAAFGKRCRVPVMMIVFSAIASYYLFRNDVYGSYSGYYQKIGIGFSRIATDSFYWYIPPVFSIVAILLFRLRARLSPAYSAAGFLLIYCAIGNSIYFFGRSHEHNILNISVVLLFLLFLLLDLITRYLDRGADGAGPPSFFRRHGVNTAAVALIALIVASYSHNIVRKGATQIRNAGNAQLMYPPKSGLRPAQGYLEALRAATGSSDRVYFVNRSDFLLYYYGGYAPVGFCNPFQTWIFTRDLNLFLQGLLEKGYYLVYAPELQYMLPAVRYRFVTVVDSDIVVSNTTTQAPRQ